MVVKDSVVSNCDVRDNHGPGIWLDINCDNNLITKNHIEGNATAGIFYEISRGATISDNTVINNAHGDERGWFWGGGILVSTSHEVVVKNNVLEGNNMGLIAIDQRTARMDTFDNQPAWGRLPNWAGHSVEFVDNVIDNCGRNAVTASGVSSTNSTIYTTSTFEGNTYTGTNTWWWGLNDAGATEQTFAEWQSAGRDD